MVEGSSSAIYPRVNTMPPEIAEKLELPVGLQRSRTERQRNNNVLADEAAQIFDDRIPVQQKVKILYGAHSAVGNWDTLICE